MDHLTTFVAAMVALSAGVERIVEMLKGMFPWLANSANPRRPLVLQVLATVAGGSVAAIVGPNQFLWFLDKTNNSVSLVGSSVLLGLMACGGSAFWNHVLDIVGAIKTTKESVAKAANPATAR